MTTSSPQLWSLRFVDSARAHSASQFDRFPPHCPTTFRPRDIPVGNIRQQEVHSSPRIWLSKSLCGCGGQLGTPRVKQRRTVSSASSAGTWTLVCDEINYNPLPHRRLRDAITSRLLRKVSPSLFSTNRFLRKIPQRDCWTGSPNLLARDPCSSVIPPRNNRVTRSCWTCCLSSVTFAPQAADLRCCGRRKCLVGREVIPSAK